MCVSWTKWTLCFVLLSASVSIHRAESLPSLDRSVLSDGNVRSISTAQTPKNTVALVGDTVVLECAAYDTSNSRVLWVEFITSQGGQTISDTGIILANHPNRDRYRIIHSSPTEYHLEISHLQIGDGGTYMCQDINSDPPNLFQGYAELVVLESSPLCSTTLPFHGTVLESETQTAECSVRFQGKYSPSISWTGPPPFKVTNTLVDSNVMTSMFDFTAQRCVNGRAYYCIANFTDIGKVPKYYADNTPTWQHVYTLPTLSVRWPPTNAYVTPWKNKYGVGEKLTCFADASPSPVYQWLNTRTLESINGPTMTIAESWAGYNQTLLCQVQNVIDDVIYSSHVHVNADVSKY